MKLLFIGNSATYVHKIPQTLAELTSKNGILVEVGQVVKGGFELAQHADASTEYGKRVLEELQKGYDVVFLQDNGNCISTEEKMKNCEAACDTLIDVIRKNGARPMFYVRPPYGKEIFGKSPLEQCQYFDDLFDRIAKKHGIDCIWVNRAFAQAIQSTELDLWGEDHAHTSPLGAYLAVCTFYATLFGRSATELDENGLSSSEAKLLWEIADSVALGTKQSAPESLIEKGATNDF